MIKNFLKSKKGAVTIEFFFMVLLLGILFAFMADLVMLRSTLGKLDNASFSLVNILRERTQLYGRRAELTNDDLKQFEQLAKLLIYGDKNSKEHVYVVLEHWWQDGVNDRTQRFPASSANSKCTPYKDIAELKDLSPRSEYVENERKIPMYQVTLCVDTRYSLFKALLLNEATKTNLGLIRSSTMALSR